MSDPWDKPNPAKKHKKLSDDQIARAKARAKAAGRTYPNWVDNVAIAKEETVTEKKNPFEMGRSHKDITKHLKNNGWSLQRSKGEHDVYSHPKSQQVIAVPRHKGDIPPGTIRNIMAKSRMVSEEIGTTAHKSSKHFKTPETAEKQSTNKNDPDSRFDSTTSAANIYKKDTPGQSKTIKTIKDVVREQLELMECGDYCTCGKNKKQPPIDEDWSDSKYKSQSGGLTKAGVMAYRREHPGSKLQTAVTTEPSKLKKGSKSWNRRKSFCKRMSGMKKKLTSSETARDPDSRINKALRKWNC